MNPARTPNPPHASGTRDNRFDGTLFAVLFQANVVEGDVPVTPSPALDQILTFVTDLDACLEHIGDLEAVLRFIPDGLFPIIEVMADTSSTRFILEHDLSGPPLFQESLAFLLKVAWQRGYLMQKFHTLNRIPHPSGPVDPVAVMDKIIGLGGSDLSTEIEVVLQKAVSLCTDEKQLTRCLNAIQGLAPIVQPVMREWGAVTRSAYGWGLLVAKTEHALRQDAHGAPAEHDRAGGTPVS
ncbi:hypothetical protein ACFFQW_09360 [Umezawaea endophytica]|uniref:Uncharacterized protein n=1 Tax=Umezawaea endophytica TaxID=1654476 RepID=A0A9X2VRI2_9PSEU|nr:hypothetical protein [Umezawaea endophytica]MCS7481316.1 hypothetical protein [Umezawaea endophytica]